MSGPPSLPATAPAKTQNGLSVTSLVLGVLSPVCLFIFTGIPAVITGHIAYGRAKKQPQVYGGAGMALAGLILGYISIATTLLLGPVLALMLPALAHAKGKADFLTMSNELNSPRILVCPGDSTKTKAENWAQFNSSQNVTYEFLTPGAKEADIIAQAAFRCPIHNNIALGDGSVQQTGGRRR
jgi:hypothetical protein